MSASVADEILQSGYRLTVPDVGVSSPDDLAAYLDDIEGRWAYSIGRADQLPYVPTYGWRRVASACVDLWGMTPKFWRRYFRVGGPANLIELVSRNLPDAHDCCGYVYLARLPDFPHILKVGFTKNPEDRQKRLAYLIGSPVDFEQVAVGTLFDEALNLLIRERDSIEIGEWFFDRSRQFAGMPPSLKGRWHDDEWAAAFASPGTGAALTKIYTAHLSGEEL